MQTLSRALLAFSLLAVPAALPGCAEDGCIDYPSDARCKAIQTSDIVLLTYRLPKSGGRLLLQVKSVAAGDRITATLGPNGPMVTFAITTDGTYAADVSQSTLSSIPLGPLAVTFNAGPKTLYRNVFIYTPSTYATGTVYSTATVAGRNPAWVQIAVKHVFTAEDSNTATNRRIFEYVVSGGTITGAVTRDTHATPLPLGTVLDISETQTLRLLPTGGTYSLQYDPLSGTGAYTDLKTLLNYSKADSLAVDRKSTSVAIAGEGTDGPLKVFTVPMTGNTTAQVNVTGIPAGKQPVQVAWGYIDDDTLVDLVAIHSDLSFGVYLQKATQGLAYDAGLSTALGTSAGLQSGMPTALAVGDVDRDGLDDIVLSQAGQVSQVSYEGNSIFSKVTLLSGAPADAVAVGDVTGDGKADLAMVQKGGAMLLVYPNQVQ